MRVAKVQVGILGFGSASQMCEYLGKVRDGRICESPIERLKIAA